MKNRYLLLAMLLFPIAAISLSNRAHAADPDKALYDAALAAFPSGSYYIMTEIDGIKYYVNNQGEIVERTEYTEASEGLFTINQVSGGAYQSIGWHIEGANGHFSNTTLADSKAVLHPGTGVFRLDTSNNRNDWESQVFFLNEEGKIAIRSCNTAYGESSWADAGRAFWTYEVDEVGDPIYNDYGNLDACYTYEPAFIWTLEEPSGKDKVYNLLNAIYSKYEDQVWEEDPENPTSMNMGTEFGQLADFDTWMKFWTLLQEVNELLDKIMADGYDFYSDPDAPTIEQSQAYSTMADSLYQAILDSEVPYVMPQEGYYRIYAHNRYTSTYDESGFVDKAIAASIEAAHENKAVYATVLKNRANFLWKLTKSESGDSILMQNAALGTYVSFSSPAEGRVIMTTDVNDASYVMFDYAYGEPQYVEPEGEGTKKDIFSIRLASEPRDGNYFHQTGHSSQANDDSPWGNYGTDTGVDQEIGFWIRTWNNNRTTDLNTSEWFLEFVPEDEAAQIIAEFDDVYEKTKLIEKNNDLRSKVAETLALAKDVIQTNMITSANQLSSPNSDEAEGTNIGNLIDGDGETFWHTSWHNSNQYPRMIYNDGEVDTECHYLQISGMKNFVGENCNMYFRERSGADNDRPTKVVLMGIDELPELEEGEEIDYGDDWTEMAVLTLPHTGKGEENTLTFSVEEGFNYVRVLVPEVNSSFRTFWHAAEIQFYTLQDNPNSQFNQLGDIALTLQEIYDANCATPDEEITEEMYEALLNAYNAFLAGGLVDPAELRAALATYANATKGVVEGTDPGYWADMTVPNAYDELYAEAEAYNVAGIYSAALIHKYAVMLKAMKKNVMAQANGVTTDKWYRIMYPTEEMFDAYEFNKDGGDNCNDLVQEDQQTMWGTFVSTAKLESEEVQDVDEEGYPKYDNDGNEVMKTIYWLEATGGEDLRESDRLFFMNDDAIEDKDASMFRFVEIETETSDFSALLTDVKEDMSMALDLTTTYIQGEPLITKASQFSSNASYPGNDGQKLETGCLIDGNTSTYWHSDYSRTFCVVPYLQVALNEPVSGLIQVYVARRNTSNGHVVRMYVQGSNDAETWTNIGYIETPYTNANTPATSNPLDLCGTFSHLRFIMTNRYGTDGGSNIEFDPFAENLTGDDYNTKFTYFHASEFQIYPVTPSEEFSASAQALQQALVAANKIVLKDATAEDLAAAAQAYTVYQKEFNTSEGKAVLPDVTEKAPASYALQNKATGLYVMVSGTGNQNNIYLKTVPTIVGYKAIGYERSLLSAKTVEGVSCNNLHAGESNRRFCTWGSTEPTSNSGLVICEADEEYEAPAEFTYYKDIKPGKIYGLCNSVNVTPEATDDAAIYTPLGQYTVGEDEDAETYLALKQIETIPAGEPVFYIYDDTLSYDAEDDYVEPIQFTMPAEKPVLKGKMVNGLLGSLVNHTLEAHEIYFTANYAKCIGSTGSYLSGPCVALDIDNCPQVDPEGQYDFSIFLGGAATDAVDGVKNISSAIEKISQPGNVYTMDGKLLRSGATLNSLKSLGKGMYILNGVKVIVK